MVLATTIGCPGYADSGASGDGVDSIQNMVAIQHLVNLVSWYSPSKKPQFKGTSLSKYAQSSPSQKAKAKSDAFTHASTLDTECQELLNNFKSNKESPRNMPHSGG